MAARTFGGESAVVSLTRRDFGKQVVKVSKRVNLNLCTGMYVCNSFKFQEMSLFTVNTFSSSLQALVQSCTRNLKQ